MNIYLLTTENLRSNAFIKEFAFHFKPKGKAVLLHDTFGSPEDTRFVTKRLSAYLSEELVVNAILNGDQRNLISRSENGFQVRLELLHAGFHQVDLLVLNELYLEGGLAAHAGLEHVLSALKALYPQAPVTMFPSNPRSALGQGGSFVADKGVADRLAKVYDEERELLELAGRLAPVKLMNPSAFQPAP